MHPRFILSISALLIIHCACCVAQDEPPPIRDNSFLIEEAYNQEPGVVQHIATAMHFRTPERYWALSWTQEAPLIGQHVQISWVLPLEFLETTPTGQVGVNLRYQLPLRSNAVAVAPRFSLFLITTGYPDREGIIMQANLPLSLQISSKIVTHLNAGFTRIPGDAIVTEYDQRPPVTPTLFSYGLGTSIVWLYGPNLNFLCEFVRNYEGAAADLRGNTRNSTVTVINPGVRVALNPSFGQFVPGFGLPIRIAEDRTDVGVFMYFSFEHTVSGRSSSQ